MGLLIVTGLPRSGTAFVSTLLNFHPGCLAYHELAARDANWRKTLYESMCDIDYVADCNTYAYTAEYKVESKKSVYIKTDRFLSQASAEKACQKTISLDLVLQLEMAAANWARQHHAMVILRKDVFTVQGMNLIWNYCFDDDTRFPIEKARELLKLNVQHHDAHIWFGKDKILKL